MHGARNLVVDNFSEVYQLLKPWCDHDFWDISQHDIVPNSIYVIGRKQFVEHSELIKNIMSRPDLQIVFDNAAEGSWTLIAQLQALKLDELARNKELLLIGGGDMDSNYAYVRRDHFLSAVLGYDENQLAMQSIDQMFEPRERPYKFMFLNGRSRPHRKYLYERFRELGILDQALWTMLDSRPSLNRDFRLEKHGVNVMATPSELRWLPREYEFEFFQDAKILPGPPNRTFVKFDLFNNLWGEIYLTPRPYLDSYFSLVTETVFEYPYSFRTEKIAKVLAMGHPWIVAGSVGFLRDMRALGFQTFDGIIDESYDLITNNQQRMEKIISIVQDLCSRDLTEFLAACEPICKYNQQHLRELVPRMNQEFPQQFFSLIDRYERP